ncbi:MAG: hypothetical protein HY997_22755 [Mycolicibacterium neoaurum]|nr:hypothetical protein [Mycolicibacterium neoaurum]
MVVLVAVSITDIVPALPFATYTRLPLGVMASPAGVRPTGMLMIVDGTADAVAVADAVVSADASPGSVSGLPSSRRAAAASTQMAEDGPEPAGSEPMADRASAPSGPTTTETDAGGCGGAVATPAMSARGVST